ncbi:hypothetical protein PS6_003633 [Mucor atramentarius]
MDNKNNMYPNPPDVDVAPSAPPSYEYTTDYQQQQATCSSSHHHGMTPNAPPSIPPSQHFSYGSVLPQPIYSYQNAHYQHQQYEEPPQRYRYIIQSRERGVRHFPVNAAFFVLGCVELDCVYSIHHLLDSTHAGRKRQFTACKSR